MRNENMGKMLKSFFEAHDDLAKKGYVSPLDRKEVIVLEYFVNWCKDNWHRQPEDSADCPHNDVLVDGYKGASCTTCGEDLSEVEKEICKKTKGR